MGGQDVVVARWPLVSDDRPDSGSRLAERIYLILLIDRLCANHVWQSTPPPKSGLFDWSWRGMTGAPMDTFPGRAPTQRLYMCQPSTSLPFFP